MPETPVEIVYELRLENGVQRRYALVLDPKTLLAVRSEEKRPEWARLGNSKCPNCPLHESTTSHCPAATAVADIVDGFQETWSFEPTEVRVHFSGRTTFTRTDAQGALGSLLGVALPASGCPVLGALRPLVRFHLPLASELETMVRAVSMYLVAQFLQARGGGTPDWSLQGLVAIYEDVEKVNRAFAVRLRTAASKDAHINALIRLDAYAKALPDFLARELGDLQPLLDAWTSRS